MQNSRGERGHAPPENLRYLGVSCVFMVEKENIEMK